MDMSVIVLTYNRQEMVKELIEVLRRQNPDLEIICVSDGCDPKPDVSHLCKYLWQDDIGNRAATARNLAMAHTTHDKIVLLDDDIRPHPLCLYAHSLALEMFDLSYGLLPDKGFIPEMDSRLRMFINEQELLWKFAFSGNFGLRRSAWERVGPFDEIFNGGHGFEDIDWAYRAKRLGLRFHLNRLAMAVHPFEHVSDSSAAEVLLNQRRFNEKWDGILENGFEL